ncbi:HNH endonuclease signature motif containing protein [Geodermatophilus marinus]|uniref:HNH endonuclease signature motif containing protein n=1 Tax=Geodermatophilus sp. LHW52908 TaxID=2303986 RepID=UPI000E3E57D4|nr:HNH endonuclease signature motif containing protein [Geodermatophilus sp. LHW52908]RFU21701.1 HNH endonuclease [Geodermatophilus sp. LHW52908]
MSELGSALDELTGLDLDELADGPLLELVGELVTAANRVAAALTTAVRAADRREAHRRDGAVSMRAWLRGQCRLAPSDAAAIVSTGRRLAGMPATAAAFAAGEITAAHARVITKAMTPRRVAKAAEAGIDHTVTDRILAELARRTGPGETAQGVARWVAGVDPDGTLDDAADTRRRLSLAAGTDGRVHLRGELDAVGGEVVRTALTALMNGDRPAGDLRGHAERQADALVALARGALDGGALPAVRGERAHVRVTIDWQALCAARGTPGVAGGELGWAGPINPETARRLACDAQVVRIITGPDGLPLDVGRAQRTATAAIRRAVELRDGHCVFAGCDAPPEWCDVHHVIHWAFGGPTSCDNGALLCERHHTACHEGGFSVSRDPRTSTWHTRRPDGSEVRPPLPHLRI